MPSLSNLPPGVTESMIPGNRPEDADDGSGRLHCDRCGGFLRTKPDREETRSRLEPCNGARYVSDDNDGYFDIHFQCDLMSEHRPHMVDAYIGGVDIHECTRCGKVNRFEYY